ncbi:peptidyl-tRNA hydrolase Pth2 [Candidatus Woesearchaeota archaeon]|nr:peptidyl-tRNA hydrolase Pth2 [Candidatus Woesearchaeota archaeon]
MTGFKQVIVVRTDLKLPAGKLATQVAHASVDAAFKSSRIKLARWKSQGAKKVVLKVGTLDELKELYDNARKEKLKAVIITDAGRTVLKPGTTTCLGIGPDVEEKIDKVTGKLKML